MSEARYVVVTFPQVNANQPLGIGPHEEVAADPAKGSPEVSVVSQPAAMALAAKENTLAVHAGLPYELIEPASSNDVADAAIVETPWGLEAVGALASKRTGQGIAVAVLDTGCDVNHEAFTRLRTEKRIVSKNFTTDGGVDDVTDKHGHGTHCCGTVCGDSVGGTRIGVAPGVNKLIVAKIIGPGGGSNDVILSAIVWAVQQGAKVISMSLGTDFPGWVDAIATLQKMPVRKATSVALKSYRDAITQFGKLGAYLSTQGVVLVAASGNESERPGFTLDKSPPSASETFISVAAVSQNNDKTFGIARFSNTGADVAAPGVDVVSAKSGGGLSTKSGTSMATPHVAGIAALWYEELSAEGIVTYDLLRNRLLGRATPLPGLASDDIGAGLVQAP